MLSGSERVELFESIRIHLLCAQIIVSHLPFDLLLSFFIIYRNIQAQSLQHCPVPCKKRERSLFSLFRSLMSEVCVNFNTFLRVLMSYF